MNRPVLFACDFETTGLDPRRDYPHQLAITVLVPAKGMRPGYEVAERRVWRMRVPRRARYLRRKAYFGAMSVHRIPGDVLHNIGRSYNDVATAVRDLAKKYTNSGTSGRGPMLAAQNLAFDAGFMRRLFDLGSGRHNGERFPAYPFGYHGVDLTGLAVMLLGTSRFKETVAALGVTNREAHDAQGDADMLADCLVALAKNARYTKPAELR